MFQYDRSDIDVPYRTLRLATAILSFLFSAFLVVRIRTLKQKSRGSRYPRVHWVALEFLGYADLLNALNYIGAATSNIVLSTVATDYYREHGFPWLAHVLFPVGYFSGFCQLAFGSVIPWLLHKHLFTFQMRDTVVQLFMRQYTLFTVVLASVLAATCSILIIYPLTSSVMSMSVTTAISVASDFCFLLTLMYGYFRLRNQVLGVLKTSPGGRSRFNSILFRGFLYTITYLVAWFPLNFIRFFNTVGVFQVSINVRAAMDCLGGSAGIINGLAFFAGEKAFPCCSKSFGEGNGNSRSHTPEEGTPNNKQNKRRQKNGGGGEEDGHYYYDNKGSPLYGELLHNNELQRSQNYYGTNDDSSLEFQSLETP